MTLEKISPWPFVGMAGLAGVLFLYGASILLAPGWFVAVLVAVWLVMFVLACRWWTPHPVRVAVLPVFGVVLWFVSLTAGDVLLGWTA